MSAADVVVRRLTPDDGPAMRALRLEALADTPLGFLETLAEAEAHDDEHWRSRAARGSTTGDSHQVMAFAGECPVATCVTFTADGRAWLAGVYVAPDHRGRGLLAELVRPLAAWQAARGHERLELEVHEDNARARAAYARLGFVETGERRPYPLDPSREELVMALPLRP